ncbi:Tubulointerstitial nephritis antigen [Papilio xuthus]|uniref:Tubulointerstitial nephritis antigen n=1 Tax=Papilio xuthus TaxID=66420 RepID=A0A194Q6V6_PAPXU|nr:Tubulointerstitial nephritis antigen [Papilio xuthus]
MNTDWHCEDDPCLMSSSVVEGVNRGGSSWRAYNYPEFRNKKLKEGLIYKLGTFPLNAETRRMGPLRYDKDVPYPTQFDARTRWPGFISPIVDQGWCGSDWAVSLAGVASDRFAIQSNGAENMVLSPQTLLSCNVRAQQGCHGGHIDVAWNFARGHGLVDEKCFPYKASVTRCPFRPRGNLIQDGCMPLVKRRTSRYKLGPPAKLSHEKDIMYDIMESGPVQVDEKCFPYKASVTRCPFRPRGNLIQDGCMPLVKRRTSRYKLGPPAKLSHEKDIMYDIMESGPVQAVMTVYQDFFHYRDGVYRRSYHGNNELKGFHSVRIIGWGEDRGDRYWVVANSWGRQWGENGYFRIARGSNEADIESFVVTGLSDVTEANQK